MKQIKTIALLFIAIYCCSALSALSQSYSIEKEIGGEGEIGDKIKYSGSGYAMFQNSIYFKDENTEKILYQVNEKGIIQKKIFPFYYTSGKELNDIEEFTIDNAGNLITIADFKSSIQSHTIEGDLLFNYRLDGFDSFFTYNNILSSYIKKIALNIDNKNNIYIGTDQSIIVLDNLGTFQKKIGSKGANDGQFDSIILKILFDELGNMMVWTKKKIQKFNAQGEFVSKIILAEEYQDLTYFKQSFYCTNSKNIQKIDEKGNLSASIAFAGAIGIDIFKDNLFITKDISEAGNSKYVTIDITGKPLDDIGEKRNLNSIGKMVDYRIDNTGNIIVQSGDTDKLIKYSEAGLKLSVLPDFNSITRTEIDELVEVKSINNVVYIDNRQTDQLVKSVDLNTNQVKQIFKVNDPDNFYTFLIDSTYKDFILMKGGEIDKEIVLYNFDGTIKKSIYKGKRIGQITKGRAGNIVLIKRTDDGYKFEIVILSREGTIIKKINTNVGQIGSKITGIGVDEGGLIHFSVIDGENAIYSYDEQGNSKGLLTSISYNGTNLVFGNTKLLQVYKENIYLGDEENAKIFRLKYRPDIKVKEKTKIEVFDKFEKFSTFDFILETSSQSNSPFIYKILLGESISINNTGSVKMLKPGKTVVKISQAENDIYEATSKTITINILSNAAIITKISPISKKVDDVEFKLSPTSNSNGAFSFKIKTGDAVSVDATGAVKIVKAGTATIQIDQAAGKDNFGNNLDASSIIVDILVNKLSQTISYNSPPKSIFNDNKGEVLVATSSSGLAVIYKVISGPATIVNGNTLKPSGGAGKVVVEISQAGNEKYSEASILKIEIEIKAAPILSDEEIVFDPNAILYPNPTNNVLNINNVDKFEYYRIVDGLGKIYNSGPLNRKNLLNVEELTTGLYIVELFGGKSGKRINYKLLIKK